MKLSGRVVVVDDDPTILVVVKRVFSDMGLECFTYERGADCLNQLDKTQPDIVFVDLAMPELDGLSLLRALRGANVEVPVVLITAFAGLDSAVRAVHDGAFEFLTKPLDLHHLREVTRRGLELRNLSSGLVEPEKRIERSESPRLVGRHPTMVTVYKLIGALSAQGNRSTVLITGETGTGKELVAHSIHESSVAHGKPFIAIHCAGVPETLIENELFGHEKGAFTGAESRYDGRVAAAGSGSVFLDEIGELSLPVQVKLLRLLETREFERLGGNVTLRAECRFIAATNRNLEQAVRKGTFREDLFYRLKVVEITMPPLRERLDDVPLLVAHFLDRIGRRLGRSIVMAPEALAMLRTYDFPGNVREMFHLIEQAATLARGPVLQVEHFPELHARRGQAQPVSDTPADFVPPLPMVSDNLKEARQHIVECFEKQFIERTLRLTRGNVSAAARQAGVRRQHFQRLMRRFGINAEHYQKSEEARDPTARKAAPGTMLAE